MLKQFLKISMVLPLLLSLAACGSGDDNRACGESEYLLSKQCNPLRWASLPVLISVASLNVEYQNAAREAELVWEEATGRDLFILITDSGMHLATMNRIEFASPADWDGGPLNAAAQTKYTASGNRFTSANILINSGMQFSLADSDLGIDMVSVLIHELGHVLGLGHTKDPETVMYPELVPNYQKRSIFDKDLDSLSALYGW